MRWTNESSQCIVDIEPMHRMNLSAIDLNLLVALDALLETRSPTLAAKRIALSQPATSHALARLRELFGDALLVRSGRALVPTPFAESLRPLVRDAVGSIERALAGPERFDPRTSRRVFSIAAGDYVTSLVVPELSAHLAEKAPLVELFVKPMPGSAWTDLRDVSLDVVLAPYEETGSIPGIRHEPLFTDRFVGLVRRGHRFDRRTRIDLDEFCAADHVLVAPWGATRRGRVDDALGELGRARRIVVAVPHFLVAPSVVARTDYVVTIGTRLAEQAARIHDLRIIELPLVVPDFTVDIAWHSRQHDDPGHRFLRDALRTVTERRRSGRTSGSGGRTSAGSIRARRRASR